MLIFRLLCLVCINAFATIELYDMNGNLTGPLEWCDQSDPVKVQEFREQMNDKYNEMLKIAMSRFDIYGIDEVSNFVNCYNAYKMYNKSSVCAKIADVNNNIASFLIGNIENIYPEPYGYLDEITSVENCKDAKQALSLYIFMNCIEGKYKIAPTIKTAHIKGAFNLTNNMLETICPIHNIHISFLKEYKYMLRNHEEVYITNESEYPVSIIVQNLYRNTANYNHCIKRIKFDGKFNFISTVMCNVEEILFSDDSVCKNYLPKSNFTYAINHPNVIVMKTDETYRYSDIEKYCKIINTYYKYCNNTLNFNDWIILHHQIQLEKRESEDVDILKKECAKLYDKKNYINIDVRKITTEKDKIEEEVALAELAIAKAISELKAKKQKAEEFNVQLEYNQDELKKIQLNLTANMKKSDKLEKEYQDKIIQQTVVN